MQFAGKYCSLPIAMLNCVVFAFAIVNVIATVNPEQAETQFSGDRSHGPGPQADNVVYFDKTLLRRGVFQGDQQHSPTQGVPTITRDFLQLRPHRLTIMA